MPANTVQSPHEAEHPQAQEEGGYASSSASLPPVVAQGDEATSVEEPWFPDLEDATAANQEALAEHGQVNHALLRPEVLEGALGRAANYHYYEGNMPKAAAALAHGIGQAQAFEDGNKRTAYHVTRAFLNENGLGHMSPYDHDDDEFAQHLVGYGEKTHDMPDTVQMFEDRDRKYRNAYPGTTSSVQRATEESSQGKVRKRSRVSQAASRPVKKMERRQQGSRASETTRSVSAQERGGSASEASDRSEISTLSGLRSDLSMGNHGSGPHEQEDSSSRSYDGSKNSHREGNRGVEDLRNSVSNVSSTEASFGTTVANILDPIHDGLDPRVFSNPKDPQPILRPEHRSWIIERVFTVLDEHGYDGMEKWLSIVLTGSLTTYQYSDESDVDCSLFVDTKVFPEWSRADMIGIMVDNIDGTKLPGTPFPMQIFVVAQGITKMDLYKPGLRSGYDLFTQEWIVPPDKGRIHNVEKEMNEAYTIGLESADKMERLLRYEPDKAVMYWHQLHSRRRRDQQAGKGDYAPSNIVYKMLANRGLFEAISEASGEYIA